MGKGAGRNKKIIHIITRVDKGGSAQNTLITVKGLLRKDYKVILLKGPSYESQMSSDEDAWVDTNLREIEELGGKIITVHGLLRRLSPLNDFISFLKLMAFLMKERPLIVHTHSSKAGFLGRWAAFFTKIPIIIHTPHGHVFWGYFGKWETGLYMWLEKISTLITDKLIAISFGEERDYITLKIAPKEKLTVIHSGVEIESFNKLKLNIDLKKTLGISENDMVIGTVGRLAPVKGQRYLIEATRILKDKVENLKFLIVGDGPLRPALERLAKGFELKNIIFTGWRKDIPEILSVMDIFVLPSLNEGMGRALVEAMAAGLPIVATNVSGIPDLVKHKENGLLVPSKDSHALADAIMELIEDKEKRKIMGKKGKERAKNYSAPYMIEKIDELYQQLVRLRGESPSLNPSH